MGNLILTNSTLTDSPVTQYLSYGYNGNCTSVVVGGNTTSLTYDFENRVTGITYQGGATNSFQYNGLGLRTQKVDSAGTFNYVCDGTTPASAVLSDSAAIYTPGLSERRSSTSKFYHGDALSSTRGITNSSQTATDSKLFDAFGMTVSSSGSTPTPFGFVGGAQYQTDSDSGLMLLGHRYYDSSVGRFVSQDPAKHGGNWYVYCDNNPMNSIDATGLFKVTIYFPFSPIPGFPIGGPKRIGVGEIIADPGDIIGWNPGFGFIPPMPVFGKGGEIIGTFPANNETRHPDADPKRKNAGGPFPTGQWPIKEVRVPEPGTEWAYGPIKVIIGDGNGGEGPYGRFDWIHGRGDGDWMQPTDGCIRIPTPDLLKLADLVRWNPGRNNRLDVPY